MVEYKEGDTVIRVSEYGNHREVGKVLGVTARKVITTWGDFTKGGELWGYAGAHGAPSIRHPNSDEEVDQVKAEIRRGKARRVCTKRLQQVQARLKTATLDDMEALYVVLGKFIVSTERQPDA